ncbi:putative ATP-grasp-modified RiPP [Crossiella sp. S99.2]|uniref:putative ATP-grasp-modified RiPP n=1 Tax=unclassified Crossiella TaxID=2620835 RepID=UPI0035AB9AEF
MKNLSSVDPISPASTLFSTGRGEAREWDAGTARSFGLRRMVPTEAHEIVDLTGLRYDPIAQMTNAGVLPITSGTYETGTQQTVTKSTNQTTTRDHQSWPDSDTETFILPDTDL